jgi:hypothetical protein
MIRTLTVGSLLGLACLLSIIGNAGLWVDRTVYDTDTFVATTDDVLDDRDVQEVLAERFAQELFVAANVDTRLREELPEGLKFLALPLSNASQEFLRNASLRLLERQPLEDARNTALQDTHARLISAIEGDSEAVTTEGDSIVIDLRPVLERVAEDVTGRDVQAPREGGAEVPEIPPDVLDRLPPEVRARVERDANEPLLPRAQIPEDAGRFVINDSAIAWSFRGARYFNNMVYVVIGVAVASYALAILFARDRRGATRNAGIVLAIAGVISLALLLPVEYATVEFAKNDDAAMSVIDIVSAGYKEQSLTMIGTGLVIAAVAALFGQSAVAVALRSAARREPDAPSLGSAVRERVTALRIIGFVGAAVALIVWPDPTARIYVTIFALLGAYLLLLFVISSDSSIAVRARDTWDTWSHAWFGNADDADRGWVSAHAATLRIAGIAAALALLVAWPDLSLRFFVTVVALAFIYLAGVDLASRRRST